MTGDLAAEIPVVGPNILIAKDYNVAHTIFGRLSPGDGSETIHQNAKEKVEKRMFHQFASGLIAPFEYSKREYGQERRKAPSSDFSKPVA